MTLNFGSGRHREREENLSGNRIENRDREYKVWKRKSTFILIVHVPPTSIQSFSIFLHIFLWLGLVLELGGDLETKR